MQRRTRRRLLAAALAAAAGLAGLGIWVWAGLPARAEVRALRTRSPGLTRLMAQRREEARVRGRRARIAQAVVPLASVSRHLIHAVLAAEDQKFFGHGGVDWDAIQESLERNVEKRRFARGGSTITQQLAKNLYFGTRRTPLRKLRELVVTRWLEDDLGKPQILALYLNVIEWGDGIYGAEAAARHWYGKPAAALSATEAAGLAAMIPNPRRINPERSPARHERATRRVLWLMGQAGYIGRDVAPLGAEPPAEPVADDEEAEEVPPLPPPSLPPPSPTSDSSPSPSSPSPSPSPPSAFPSPTAAPPPPAS
jgi:monofunctional biosynthetic peptidoglycan transglycosylase